MKVIKTFRFNYQLLRAFENGCIQSFWKALGEQVYGRAYLSKNTWRWWPAMLAFVFFAFFVGNVSAQSPCAGVVMPAGTLCISQEAGNAAAENARELAATKEKVVVLEQALVDKDKIIADNKDTAAKNEADLRKQLHKTESDLSLVTGQLIAKEAELNRNILVIDVLLKNTRKKCAPLSICF